MVWSIQLIIFLRTLFVKMVEPDNATKNQLPRFKLAAESAKVEATLELTIKKAELTGERLAQFTQSYVQIECQGNKNRTPNAAQKDQHAPVWNATIKIPVTIPAKLC